MPGCIGNRKDAWQFQDNGHRQSLQKTRQNEANQKLPGVRYNKGILLQMWELVVGIYKQ